MRKFLEKVSLLLVLAVVLIGSKVQVEASEVGTTEHPLVEVLIEMIDSTSMATCEDIVITLTNMETGETEVLTLTWTETYGIGELYRTLLPADIEYSVSCSVKGYDNIELLDIKGGKVPSLSVPLCGALYKWQIVDVQGDIETDTIAAEAEKDDVIVEMSTEVPASVETGNKEADEVFNHFLEIVSVIETDEKYYSLLNVMDGMDVLHAPNYVKYVGGTEEEYKALSLFEKYIVYETYMEVQRTLSVTGSYSEKFGTKEKFKMNYIYNTNFFGLVHKVADEEVEQAIVDILLWQYDYIMEHGCCYNFITGKSYLEIGGESKFKNEALQQEAEKNAADMQAVYDDLVASGDIKDPSDIEKIVEGEKGLGDVILDIIKDNVFSVVLIVIILGLLGAIAVMKKKYNYTSDDDK